MGTQLRNILFRISRIRILRVSRMQSECGKIRTRKTPKKDTFHAVHWSSTIIDYSIIIDYGWTEEIKLTVPIFWNLISLSDIKTKEQKQDIHQEKNIRISN